MEPFTGNDVNYRAWVGIIDDEFDSPHATPAEFVAERPAHDFYANREWATECSLGVNESEIQNPKGLWSVVFRRGEEPLPGQIVKLVTLASCN